VLRDGGAWAVGMLPERVALARDLCASWVKDGHTHALAVCVARRGVVVLDEAFGQLRPEEGSPPLARDSLFPLSSGTKPFTATLAMQLVEDGLLGLNRPVRDYLPEIDTEGGDEILVHHLLTHTSGYAFHSEPPMAEHVARKLAAGFETPPCPGTLHPILNVVLTLFWDTPLECRPGEKMIYSNHNYELLGEIVRRLSGHAIQDVARERLFAPLGMDDSYYVVPESEVHRVVQRPPEAPLGGEESPVMQGLGSRQMQETPYAGAGAFSTPRDVARFGQAFLEGGRCGDARILSPASVAAMTRDQIPGIAARFGPREIAIASWGYGWTIESPAKWKLYHGSLIPLGTCSHGGAGGFKLWVDPQNELVGVYIEACLRGDLATAEQFWNADLFENAIHAAIDDA
jgi:CubicO group peptidase (beta-lactamase class C family)